MVSLVLCGGPCVDDQWIISGGVCGELSVWFLCDGHGDGMGCFVICPSTCWGADFFKDEVVGSWFGEFEGMPCDGFGFSIGEVACGFCCPCVCRMDEVGPSVWTGAVICGVSVPPS